MGTTFRKGFLFCLFLFICLLHVSPSAKAEAAGPRTQQLPGRVLDWVMDDQNGYIYALTEKEMLLFIEASTLAIGGGKIFFTDNSLTLTGIDCRL
ncbi:hypothetical protein [Geobacillus kaustophilus]|uniref:hypothetical protein n=1 Tax=Geobacillus kaustophilus TaxID=1462 RepID=UPI000AE5C849|nr:hypothetical protein [Geobacillus kaustophilus]